MARLRNRKQEAFAREIAALTPYATAYALAGYGGDPRWHPFNASKLSGKPAVRARIDELRTEFDRLGAIHADYVRHKLLQIVEADVRDLYEPDPEDSAGKRQRLRSISDLPRRLTSAITRLKVSDTGEPLDIVFAGKNEAAATLLKSLPGGSIERHEHEHVSEIGARLASALARVDEPRQITAEAIEAAPVEDYLPERV